LTGALLPTADHLLDRIFMTALTVIICARDTGARLFLFFVRCDGERHCWMPVDDRCRICHLRTGLLVVEGEPTDDSVLERAGVKRARR
jgi:hypothetical protein